MSLPIIISVMFCISLGVCVCECHEHSHTTLFYLLGLFILGSIFKYLFVQLLIVLIFYNHFWFFIFGDGVEWEVMHGVLFFLAGPGLFIYVWEGLVESGDFDWILLALFCFVWQWKEQIIAMTLINFRSHVSLFSIYFG